VTGGSLAAESFPAPGAVLDVVLAWIGDAATATGTTCGVDELAICPSGGIDSPPGDGRASLLAAQANAVIRVNEKNMQREEYLDEAECINCWAGGKYGRIRVTQGQFINQA
jgi:hypothetical protein